jgi:HSP20 family protein
MNFSDYFDDIFSNMEGDVRKVFGEIKTMVNRPKANIIRYDDYYEVQLAVPGITKEDVKVEIDEHGLTISCEKPTGDDKKYLKQEFDYSNFIRKFRIPSDVDRDQVQATYKDGILVLRLNKVEKNKRTVNVD